MYTKEIGYWYKVLKEGNLLEKISFKLALNIFYEQIPEENIKF